ncbi:hypothetical protein AB7303_19050 [Providencia rettgeri]
MQVPATGVAVSPGDKVKLDADKNIASGFESGLNEVTDWLDKATDCSFGRECSSSDIDQAGGPPHTGGDQIIESEWTDTGGNQIVEPGRTDTGGNQLPEPIEKLPGTPILDTPTLDDSAYLAEKTKVPKPGVSGKEGAKGVPSWAKGERPLVGENGNKFAERLLDAKYGKGNYDKGPSTEFNQIRKWGDRSFVDPK